MDEQRLFATGTTPPIRRVSAEPTTVAEAIEAAARVAEGECYKEGYRTWAFWPELPDGTRGNRGRDSELVRHSDAISAAIRALAPGVSTSDAPAQQIGKWLSAALDDPNVCAEMKADIEAWFAAGEPAPAQPWRVGRRVPIHVYEGERPLGTFLREEDAARAVAAVNAPAQPAPSGWLPIASAPRGVPIWALHPAHNIPGEWWAATVILGDDTDENPFDTILHYNGQTLLATFRGVFRYWQPIAAPPPPHPAQAESGEVAQLEIDAKFAQLDATIRQLSDALAASRAEVERLRGDCDAYAKTMNVIATIPDANALLAAANRRADALAGALEDAKQRLSRGQPDRSPETKEALRVVCAALATHAASKGGA